MFDQTFVDTRVRTQKPWTVAASLTVQFAGVGVLLLVPVLHPEALHLQAPVTIPLIYKLTPPPVPVEQTAHLEHLTPQHTSFPLPRTVTAPVRVPEVLLVSPDPLPYSSAAPMGLSGPTAGLPDALGAVITGPVAPPKPQPEPKPKPVVVERPAAPLKVSTGVQASKLVNAPRPVYPVFAKQTRTQGTVLLKAVIAEDGTIQNLQVISGHPLLTRAALDAVAQWRYQPTLLNGRPVQVITEISVNFTLN